MNEKIEKAVDGWFNEKICNSPVSRDTEVYNHIAAAKEDLKKRLQQELSLPEDPPKTSGPKKAAPQPEAAATTSNEGGND